LAIKGLQKNAMTPFRKSLITKDLQLKRQSVHFFLVFISQPVILIYMKLKITEDLAVGYESETYLLIDSNGEVFAQSGNTEFNDLGIEIPSGEYLVLKILPTTQDHSDGLQLGCDLEIIGRQTYTFGQVFEKTI
tara:strand:- start:225 stop:626 length:402 start_codon:yes stop_codon:yes gene_type:complete